jgi:hypothetical protein
VALLLKSIGLLYLGSSNGKRGSAEAPAAEDPAAGVGRSQGAF